MISAENLQSGLCKVFCEHFHVHKVPVGFSVKTPFIKEDGDYISFFLVRNNETPGLFRLEDDGDSVPDLVSLGVDFENETRLNALHEMTKEYQAFFNENEMLIHSEYLPEKELLDKTILFTALLLRIQDFSLTTREIVRNTFKEDLKTAVENAFKDKAIVNFDVPPSHNLQDYKVDILITPPNGPSMGIYAGTSENKALEALVLNMHLRDVGLESNTKTMLIFETPRAEKIKDRTFSRVINSNIEIAAFVGHEADVMHKIEEQITFH